MVGKEELKLRSQEARCPTYTLTVPWATELTPGVARGLPPRRGAIINKQDLLGAHDVGSSLSHQLLPGMCGAGGEFALVYITNECSLLEAKGCVVREATGHH